MQVHRIVTGHDAEGNAVVSIDDMVSGELRRPGTTAAVVWTTEGFPVDNTVEGDQARRPVGTTLDNGTVFRVIQFDPGNAGRMHRTDSVDYAVVLSGEIDMELDAGKSVHVRAGDVIVQRGTIHNWVNTGTEPCVIAFVLIHARSVTVGERVLEARG